MSFINWLLFNLFGRVPKDGSQSTTDPMNEPPTTIWTVMVSDNFHYMDSTKTWRRGEYRNYQDAVSVCQKMVDDCLEEYRPQCETPDKLYDHYLSHGDDPYIVPDKNEHRFSAWAYARTRCDVMFEKGK